MTPLSLLILIGSTSLLIITIELVRKRQLREKYSILWLAIFVFLILFSLSGNLIDAVASRLGVGYPPSLIFIAGIFFIILLLLMLSVIVSHQTDRIIKLTQKIAILEEKLNKKINE